MGKNYEKIWDAKIEPIFRIPQRKKCNSRDSRKLNISLFMKGKQKIKTHKGRIFDREKRSIAVLEVFKLLLLRFRR